MNPPALASTEARSRRRLGDPASGEVAARGSHAPAQRAEARAPGSSAPDRAPGSRVPGSRVPGPRVSPSRLRASRVLDRARPTAERAAAAALLVGAERAPTAARAGSAALEARRQALLQGRALPNSQARSGQSVTQGPASPRGRAASQAEAVLEPQPDRHGQPARSRHLGVVPEPVRRRAPRRRARVVLLVAATIAVAVSMGLVYLHVVLAQRQFALDQLNAKVQAEQTTYQNLRLQVAQLASPEHVISTAEGQLGMLQPASVTYLTPTTSIAGGQPGQATTSGSGTAAPLGDADWSQIKSQLAGSP